MFKRFLLGFIVCVLLAVPAYPDSITVANTSTLAVSITQNRAVLVLYNNGSQTIFISLKDAATTSDLPLLPGAYISLANYSGAAYAIVASGTANLRVEEATR